MKDFYYILGTDANCTTVEIREAYRKLSKKFHPDLNENDHYFESRFKEIQEAYETLSDPVRRRIYDEQFNRNGSYTPPIQNSVKRRSYPRTTAIDILFSIILITITVLFGKYVWESIKGTKVAKTPAAVAIAASPVTPPANVHHKKRKHNLKSLAANSSPKELPKKIIPVVHPQLDSKADMKPVLAAVIPPKKKIDTIKSRPAQQANKPVQVFQVSNRTAADDGLPYTSYLRSNITGVVNMHKAGDIGSAVVAVIPANSQVQVLERGNNYYKVQYNDVIGYVPKWTVKTK
jgi:hypothetical protein